MQAPQAGQAPASARVAIAGTFALACLAVLWELLLAPLGPRTGWLALKALPLFVLLPGLAHGRRRAIQWLSLLLPFYAAEGLVRAITEPGRHGAVAAVAALLALVSFVALLHWARAMRRAWGRSRHP